MMLVKLLGAASGYALAWMVTQHEERLPTDGLNLVLTVLSIGALSVRLGLDGVMVKWLASAKAQVWWPFNEEWQAERCWWCSSQVL